MSNSLVSVKGVGPATAAMLESNGLINVEQLAAASVEVLVELKGFNYARAEATISAAKEALNSDEPTEKKQVTTKEKPVKVKKEKAPKKKNDKKPKKDNKKKKTKKKDSVKKKDVKPKKKESKAKKSKKSKK